MDYQINFSTDTDPIRLKDAVVRHWGLDPLTVYAGPEIDWAVYEGPQLVALIEFGTYPGSEFDREFGAGEEFAEVCGRMSELELATLLCRELGVRAIVTDGGQAAQSQMLVTPDGWHGRVVVDDAALDDGELKILYAYQPVPSDSEIPVQDPPEWQAGWYKDGNIPEPGYLDGSTG